MVSWAQVWSSLSSGVDSCIISLVASESFTLQVTPFNLCLTELYKMIDQFTLLILITDYVHLINLTEFCTLKTIFILEIIKYVLGLRLGVCFSPSLVCIVGVSMCVHAERSCDRVFSCTLSVQLWLIIWSAAR